MTKEELDFIGSMNMCDEISDDAYKKIVRHVEETDISEDCVSRQAVLEELQACVDTESMYDENNGLTYICYEDAVIWVEELPPVTPKILTSDDCVSRQAVLDCLTATGLKKFDFILDAREKVKNLPPVTPTHGTCMDCTRNTICKIISKSKGEDWYCADFEKRGTDNG